MTLKLYEQEPYQTTFHAYVVSCVKKNELYDILLDKTLFFPEEGGQTCDKGTLNGIDVVDVQIINDAVKKYVKREERNFSLLSQYASQFGIQKIVRQYIEVLL